MEELSSDGGKKAPCRCHGRILAALAVFLAAVGGAVWMLAAVAD